MEDKLIVDLYWARNEDAIEQTAVKYGNMMHATSKSITGSHEDAEECVNDAYLKLWDYAREKKPEKPKFLLAKITRNLALNKYNEQKSEKRGGGEVLLALDEISEFVSGSESVEREVDAAEFRRLLNLFLRSLSERDCGIFINRYFDLYSTAEIARAYGIRENNVLKILSRTRERLKKYLEKEGYKI